MGLQEIPFVLRNAEARVSELGPIRFLGIEQALSPRKHERRRSRAILASIGTRRGCVLFCNKTILNEASKIDPSEKLW